MEQMDDALDMMESMGGHIASTNDPSPSTENTGGREVEVKAKPQSKSTRKSTRKPQSKSTRKSTRKSCEEDEVDNVDKGVGTGQIAIPSGVTIVDLACTDTLDGFCPVGHTVNIIGDRNSGKSILCMASMAETFHRHGDHFAYDYYDYECAVSFDVKGLFGAKFENSLNLYTPDNSPEWSIEGLQYKIIQDVESGPRYIVIDSCDVLKPKSEIEGILKPETDKKTMGLERAKGVTRFFRAICPAVAKSGSFLIVVSQAKDNIGFGAMFKPKTRFGGSALGFNAYVEMWLGPGQQIKSGDFKVGQWTKCKIERSKANGKRHTIEFPILPAYGIDDTRSNINWLVQHGVLATSGTTIDLSPLGDGFEYKGRNSYQFVEENGLEDVLAEKVHEYWAEREKMLIEKTFGGRQRRYE